MDEAQREHVAAEPAAEVRSCIWTCLCCENILRLAHPLKDPGPCTCGSLQFEPALPPPVMRDALGRRLYPSADSNTVARDVPSEYEGQHSTNSSI